MCRLYGIGSYGWLRTTLGDTELNGRLAPRFGGHIKQLGHESESRQHLFVAHGKLICGLVLTCYDGDSVSVEKVGIMWQVAVDSQNGPRTMYYVGLVGHVKGTTSEVTKEED